MIKQPGYYRRLGTHKYQCVVCQKIHTGWSSKFSANKCCHSQKPYAGLAITEAEHILKSKPRYPLRNQKVPGDKTKEKDRYGHRYRGKNEAKVLATTYNTAQEFIARMAQEESLDNLFGEYDPINNAEAGQYFTKAISPMQKLAYAFYIRNYDLAKAACIEYAQRKLEGYIKYQLRTKNEGRPT